MAHSLKIVGWLALSVLPAGCGTFLPTQTSTQRLSYVLTTQQQADAAYQSNDMKQAAALYLQLTRIIPQEADYWYLLGNAYVRLEQPEDAVQAYQQAIGRNPNHARAWHNLGIVRMRQARAAFVSSASIAKVEDPMHAVSTQLADELTRISLGGAGKPPNPVASVAPPPSSAARHLDPVTRVSHVRVSKPKVPGTTAGLAAPPVPIAATPLSIDHP